MELSDFDYDLPKELIAQFCVHPKDHSRLMIVKKDRKDSCGKNIISHKRFYDIIDYFLPEDVLVLNETKVSRAKIIGKKNTGGAVEIILVKKIDESTYEAKVYGKKIKEGVICEFNFKLMCEVIEKKDDLFVIKFNQDVDTEKISDFTLPLPPYVKSKLENESDYQTIYSKKEGSLAAPTAGLHFTNDLLEKIEKKGVLIVKVCLHVGIGTFSPIRGEISEHKMHSEEFEVSSDTADTINNRRGRLFVVGTTTLRTLESSCDASGKVHAGSGSTNIFIYPPYHFKLKFDGLITNFHLPKSTLLLLVSAYFGRENILDAYKIAVTEKYRFFSLGDAMFLVL